MYNHMSIQDGILTIFKSYDVDHFEPSDCLQKCLDLMNQACSNSSECDPHDGEKAEIACNAYGYASRLFLQNGFPSLATTILIEAWNKFSAIQGDERIRIYRAGISMYLAKTYLSLQDKGAAFRWALLTQADDLLGERTGGAGKNLLRSVLDMSEQALSEMSKIATQSLEQIKNTYGNDWSTPYAYAEDIVTKFAFTKPEYALLFATTSNVFEFPLNQSYFRSLLNKVNSDAPTAKEKGDRLEDLATYLFLLIPGLIPRRNLLEETLAYETDIVIRNLNVNSNVVSDLLGRHFLVECKNWEKHVGVKDMGYFLYRIRLTHAHFGIIFAKNGITGDEDQQKAANSIIRKAFHEDGSICVVIDNESLSRLGNGELSLWSLILERFERIRFGKTK
jgi:hypothetical protein